MSKYNLTVTLLVLLDHKNGSVNVSVCSDKGSDWQEGEDERTVLRRRRRWQSIAVSFAVSAFRRSRLRTVSEVTTGSAVAVLRVRRSVERRSEQRMGLRRAGIDSAEQGLNYIHPYNVVCMCVFDQNNSTFMAGNVDSNENFWACLLYTSRCV